MFENKRIAITGASGFLGKALIKALGDTPSEIRCLGHSEKLMVEAKRQFPNCKWLAGDILDTGTLHKLIKGVDIVFHLAAQKHIPIGEAQPTYTLMTNIWGTKNVIDSCIIHNVEEVVGISTDKAFEPQTIYGMSKYFLERMFVENNTGATRFYTCRYGNVAGSSGSVFEIWDKCGQEGKQFEITDPEMTRFYFTVEEAVEVIFQTLKKKDLTKPYIPTMKAMKMEDVLSVFMEHYNVRQMKIVGNRGNEKKHEGLSKDSMSNKVEHYTKPEIAEFLKKINLLQ